MNFGDKLKQLRIEHHLTQEELAQILEVSRQTISRWETSLTSPDLTMLEKICQYFNISYEEFLDDKKTKKINIHYFLYFFLFLILISFLIPNSKQDLTTSAIIITPAGFTLYTGIIGIILTLLFIFINRWK